MLHKQFKIGGAIMGYKSDIEIAQEAKMENVEQIAERLEIPEDYVECYGKYKAKIDYKDVYKRQGIHRADR